MEETKFDIEVLRGIALEQYGYVTTAQAVDAGVSKSNLSMLVKRDRIERVAHGVYRIPLVARTIFDRFMLALLWTGASEAVLSHETALAAFEVCDVNPIVIDVTVGKTRRIQRQGGEAYRIHYQNLDESQIGWWEGMRCVKLACAVEQCIDAGVATYLLVQAIDNGRKRGLITTCDEERLRTRLQDRGGDGQRH